MASDVSALIGALDTDDVRKQRRAGDQLIAAGRDALPGLIEALQSPSSRVRRSAAFLLSTHKASAEVLSALGRAIVDDLEPKVRKNAAISLGTIGDPRAIPVLAEALRQETIGWVRPSIILALGAIGGEEARTALRTVSADGASEREALRKALDRSATAGHTVGWRREGTWRAPLLLAVPIGLERVAIDEAVERGIGASDAIPEGPMRQVKPGLLRCPPGLAPWDIFPILRCVYHLLIDAGQGPRIPLDSPRACAAAVRALLAGSSVLRQLHDWIISDKETINYRFSIDHKQLRRETLRAGLEAAREVCLPLELVDSPSRYDVELVVKTDAAQSSLFVKPSFMEDPRFVYRHKDLGASINPVVAACLARLARSSASATVCDPTCGSGTLLIERALLDDGIQLRGIDISRTAVAAARTNIKAAGLERRIRIVEGDAMQSDLYPPCDEVLANLPWGMRTRQEEQDLHRLYQAILTNLAARLRSGGRAVLYTANRKVFEASLSRHKGYLRIERHLRVLSGGLWSNVWVLTARK